MFRNIKYIYILMFLNTKFIYKLAFTDINGKYLFEVGGSKKTFAQIKDIKNSFLAIDNEEIGRGDRIPLWLFGFSY